MKILLAVFLSLTFYAGLAQQKLDTVVLRVNVEQQGKTMGEAFVAKDYTKFAGYINPGIIKMAGGKEAMINLLTSSITGMEDQGFSIVSLSIEKPSGFIQYKDEIQCTIPQTIKLKAPGGSLVTVSTLIAISGDKGSTWTFVDTQGKPVSELQEALPNLSSDLVIPPKAEPVFTKD